MTRPTELDIRRAAGLFKVLGHPERIRIAFRLAAHPSLTQHELLEDLPWAQSTLARHVGLMRERGLIEATRHGNEVYLKLADDLVPQLLELVHSHPPVPPVGAAAPHAVVMGGDPS